MDYKKFKDFEQRAYSTVYSELPGGFHDDLIPRIVDRLLPELEIDIKAKILDIGCGPGLFAQAMHAHGYKNITGVTLSQNDVDACKAAGLPTMHASMTDLPLPDNTVDFIWCRHALEHSPYPLFTLFEFHRVLCPGGRVFIEVPAPNNERAYMHEFNPNHYSIMGDRMWMSLFEKAGFNTLAFWNYDIDIPFEGKVVKEYSLMFSIEKKV